MILKVIRNGLIIALSIIFVIAGLCKITPSFHPEVSKNLTKKI
jgi:hypothetical protein